MWASSRRAGFTRPLIGFGQGAPQFPLGDPRTPTPATPLPVVNSGETTVSCDRGRARYVKNPLQPHQSHR
ncbi:hypothetical protein SGM_4992 [Streptomyces griseoaurantiacus M045]|uniref:Uncharacterized protein n=1 Tax=Streptomyces griseoaurantiacus M045 TaxID=996637 RepID=F3NPC8_9ACTN|nr:hypothetical protein SGM_4992 [Streptomyces griseoaurantiacus M045]